MCSFMIVCQKHSALLQESEKQNYRSLTVYGAWLFQDDLKTFIFKILLQNTSVKEKNPKCRKFDNVTEKKGLQTVTIYFHIME